jgi:hypothetical protein
MAPDRSRGRARRAVVAVAFILAVTGSYSPAGNNVTWPIGPSVAFDYPSGNQIPASVL